MQNGQELYLYSLSLGALIFSPQKKAPVIGASLLS